MSTRCPLPSDVAEARRRLGLAPSTPAPAPRGSLFLGDLEIVGGLDGDPPTHAHFAPSPALATHAAEIASEDVTLSGWDL